MTKNRRTIIIATASLLLICLVFFGIHIALNRKTYTVSFYSNDGRVLYVDTVLRNHSAQPPEDPELVYGTILTGWDTDFSMVKKDMDVYPLVESVQDRPNVFAMSGVYGHRNDTVSVPFQLCGDVCLIGFDLTVGYDPVKLDLVEVYNEDGDLIINNETPGQLQMNFVSSGNVEADVDICWIRFMVLDDTAEIPVTVTVNSIYAANEDDSLYIPEYNVISATVYVFQ